MIPQNIKTAQQGNKAELARCALALDCYTFPESYVAFDVGRFRLRILVEPGGILVLLAVHFKRIVVRQSFPRAN